MHYDMFAKTSQWIGGCPDFREFHLKLVFILSLIKGVQIIPTTPATLRPPHKPTPWLPFACNKYLFDFPLRLGLIYAVYMNFAHVLLPH